MRPGISLLDLVVGLAIASILSVLLYRSLYQANQTVRVIDSLIETQTQLVFFGDRLTKDVSGAFVPLQAIPQKTEQADAKQTAKSEQPKKKEEQEKKRLKNIFMVEGLDNIARAAAPATTKPLFSFVSTNPLVIYGETTPRVVRITYSLERPTGSKLWQLKRYESPELDFKKFNEARRKNKLTGYTILQNIQAFSVTCIVSKAEEKKEEKKQSVPAGKQQKEEKPKPKEYERLTSWHDQERVKSKKSLIPEYVEVKGVILDSRHKRESPFKLLIPIAAGPLMQVQEESKPAPEQALQQAAKSLKVDSAAKG